MAVGSDLQEDSDKAQEGGLVDAGQNESSQLGARPAERIGDTGNKSQSEQIDSSGAGIGDKQTVETQAKADGKSKKSSIDSKLPSGGAAGVAKKLGSKLSSFTSKNRSQIAIGGGIIGIITTAVFIIFSLAPLKAVNMMENLFDYNWRRNNEAFDTRRKKIVKQFLRERAGVTAEKGVPIADNIPESERPFYDKVFKRMAGDNKFVRELRNKGYSVELDSSGRKLRIFQASYTDVETKITKFEEVKDYDLLTEKAAARKEVNAIVDQATEGKGWFKRIYEKRRYQMSTGTKWHWLDPIKQPVNRLKKKVATEVIDYALKNKITGTFATKVVEGLLGIKPEAQNFEKIGNEIAQKSGDAVAKKVSESTAKDLGNESTQKLVKNEITSLAEKAVTQLSETIAKSSNPVGWVLLAVGIVCSVDNFADNRVLQEAVNGYASFQYMLTFTKWESVSSQIKYGNQDGKLGQDELNANMDLLTTEDGKDVGASNNYKRAAGEQIPYDPKSAKSNDCQNGEELCVERQPRCAIYSTEIGKVIMAFIINGFDPNGTKADFQYCKSGLKNNITTKYIESQYGVLDSLGPISKAYFALFGGDGYIIEGVCGIYNAVQTALGWVFDQLFTAFNWVAKYSCFDVAGYKIGVPGICDVKNLFDKISEYGGAAISWLATKVLAPLMVPVISDQVRGPQLANAIAAGADFTANTSLRDLDAKPLNQAQATASENRYYAQLREKHNKASLAEKIFSPDNKYSFVSQVLKASPASPSAAANSGLAFVTSFANPNMAFKNISNLAQGIRKLFVPSAIADEPYRNPFGLKLIDLDGSCNDNKQSLDCVYGFSADQLDGPLGSDATKKIDKEIACSLVANIEPGDIEKPEECITAENDANGGAGGGTGAGGAKTATGDFAWPLAESQKGNITSCYGQRNGKMHPGVDIGGVPEGTPVYAIKGGTVLNASFDSEAGNHVDVDHGDGTFARYLHFQNGSTKVKTGQTIEKGQQIGSVGNTGASEGAHLHLETRTGAIWGSSSVLHNPLYYLVGVMNGVNNSLKNCPTEDVMSS